MKYILRKKWKKYFPLAEDALIHLQGFSDIDSMDNWGRFVPNHLKGGDRNKYINKEIKIIDEILVYYGLIEKTKLNGKQKIRLTSEGIFFLEKGLTLKKYKKKQRCLIFGVT